MNSFIPISLLFGLLVFLTSSEAKRKNYEYENNQPPISGGGGGSYYGGGAQGGNRPGGAQGGNAGGGAQGGNGGGFGGTKQYVSISGKYCKDDCHHRGYKYHWCNTMKGSWDYCSKEGQDYYGKECTSKCGDLKYRGKTYCYLKGGSWNYCGTVLNGNYDSDSDSDMAE